MIEVSLTTIMRSVIDGLLYGIVLAVVATGLALIWGVMKVVNLAHAHIVVLAGMITAFLTVSTGLSPLYSLILAPLIAIPIGAALYYAALHTTIGKVDVITLREEMATLMTTFGVGFIIYGSHYVINQFITHSYSTEPSMYWTPWRPASIMVMGVVIEKVRLLVAVISLIVILLAHLLLTKTRFGLYIRAVAQDSRALSLVGVDPVRTKLSTTIVATVLASIAGVLYIMYIKSITPDTEATLAPLAFVVVVLGGLGSVIGTLLGGILLGLAYGFTLNLTNSAELALAASFIILVATLIVKPQGLLGGKT